MKRGLGVGPRELSFEEGLEKAIVESQMKFEGGKNAEYCRCS